MEGRKCDVGKRAKEEQWASVIITITLLGFLIWFFWGGRMENRAATTMQDIR